MSTENIPVRVKQDLFADTLSGTPLRTTNLYADETLSPDINLINPVNGITTIRPNQSSTSSLTFTFPTTLGNATEVLTTNGAGTMYWSINGGGGLPTNNTLIVSKTPSAGQYSSIATAIANIPTLPSTTNRWVISVYPGVYTEPLITIPSYVMVQGTAKEAVIVTPDNIHNVFNMSSNTSISNLTIMSGVGITVAVTNATTALIYEVDFISCTRCVVYTSTTTNMYNQLVNCTFNDFVTSAIELIGSSGFVCTLDAQVFYGNSIVTPSPFFKCDGANVDLTANAGYIQGFGASSGVFVTNGSSVRLNAVTFDYYTRAIYNDNVGSGATIVGSGLLFQNCTYNVYINNASTTGYITTNSTRSQIYIVSTNTSFYITGKDPKIVKVYKQGGDYSSLVTALAAITDATTTNRYEIEMGAGIFTESPITLKNFISIRGEGMLVTTLQPSNNSANFITGDPQLILERMTINGPSGSGYATIYYPGSATDRIFRFKQVRFGSGNILFSVTDTSGKASVDIDGSDIDRFANVVTPFKIVGTGTNSIFVKVSNLKWEVDTGSATPPFASVLENVFDVSGADAELIVNGMSIIVISLGGGVSPNCFKIYNGCDVRIFSYYIDGFGKGIYVPNTGSAPNITGTGLQTDDCTTDIEILQTSTTGGLTGSIFTGSKITCNSDSFNLSFTDQSSGDIYVTGQLIQGNTFNTATNVSAQVQKGSNTGYIYGGTITNTGSQVNVSSGNGYVMMGTAPNDYLQYVTWNAQTWNFTTLGASTSTYVYEEYIYINSSGTLQVTTTPTNYQTTILLGKVIAVGDGAGGYTMSCIQNVQRDANNSATLIDRTMRNGIGAIVTSGYLTSLDAGSTTSPCQFKLDVSNGTAYFSTYVFTYTASNPITMLQTWRTNPAGNYISQTQNYILGYELGVSQCKWDNGSGALVDITAGKWVKHSLHFAEGGSGNGTFCLVYGQEEFASELDAQNGGVPPVPAFMGPSYFAIAGIIVTAGDTTLSASRFRDIRPQLSFHSSGTTASADHNSLLNLTVGDVHTQYMPLTGVRAMTGDLQLGGQSITGVNLVDGVDVSNHHTRHEPGGADPLTMGAVGDMATSISATANSAGIASGFTRIDHTHFHGNLAGGSLHADVIAGGASGFMSGTDKTKLDASTSSDTASVIVMRDASSASSFKSITLKNPATLVLNDTSDTKQVTLSAPTTLTSSYSFKLPISGGTSGYFLITDGTGTTSWLATSSIDHNSLNNLTTGDPHTQYLLKAGGTMAGAINMGTNNITNAGTFNGVTVETHASRHLPDSGTDPITVGTPVSITALTNANGTANSLVRSDHQHAHGAQTNGTLHAVAIASGTNGFMSGTDKQKLDDATSDETASVLMMRDANSATKVKSLVLKDPLNAFGVTLIEPTLTASYTFTYPTTGGTSGYFLTTNGSGTTSWTGTSSIDHNSLANLTTGDPHTQYLLKAGGTMAGTLNMGTQAITNAGLINGVTIQTHASRHLPDSGTDPITVGTPVTITALTNANGTANSLCRSDHQHAHGAQTDGTLHAVVIAGGANGFMSGADKTKLDNATPNNSVSTLMSRDGSGTTGIRQLYVYNPGIISLLETTNTFSTNLQASPSLGATYTFTFPTTGGTSGYVLTTNGSGTTSWTAMLSDPMTINGDMIYRSGGVPTRLPIGSSNQILTVIGGLPTWQNNTNTDNLQTSIFTDDFTSTPSSTTVEASMIGTWIYSRSTAGDTITEYTSVGLPLSNGIVRQRVTGTASRYNSLRQNLSSLYSSTTRTVSFTAIVRVNTVGVTGATIVVGYGDTSTSTAVANGFYFSFDYAGNGNSSNWFCRTVNTGSATSSSSGIAINTAYWYRLRAVMNGTTNVQFYIQAKDASGVTQTAETLVQTITTNLPGGVCGPIFKVISVGTACDFDVDYWQNTVTFSSSR